MEIKKEHNVDGSQKLLSWMGYFWITFSVLTGFLSVFSFCFSWIRITNENTLVAIIVFVLIIVSSSLIALLLLLFFPNILDILFNRIPEDDKYIKISKQEEIAFLRRNIYVFFPHLHEQEELLKPLVDFSEAVSDSKEDNRSLIEKINAILQSSILNSSLLHRMCNGYLRILNGIYTLYILDTAFKKRLLNPYTDKSTYLECFMMINDLGWELYKFDKEIKLVKADPIYDYLKKPENKKLLDFILDNSLFLRKENTSGEESCVFDYRSSARNNIKNAKEKLHGNANLKKLYVQSFRQLLSISEDNSLDEENCELYSKEIKKIKNRSDRNEALGNYYYLLASKSLKSYKTNHKDYDEGLAFLKQAEIYYENNEVRTVKVMNLKAEFHLARANSESPINMGMLNRTISLLEIGLIEGKRLSSYDQILKSLNLLCEAYKNLGSFESVKKYASEGLNVATILKSNSYKKVFNNYRNDCK